MDRLLTIRSAEIVRESSACLPGYPRTLLDTDHDGMCKFKEKDDVNYKRISGLLAKWVKELAEPPKGMVEEKVRDPRCAVWVLLIRIRQHSCLTPLSPETIIRASSWATILAP